jgi:hypothetical protein
MSSDALSSAVVRASPPAAGASANAKPPQLLLRATALARGAADVIV